MSRLRDVWLLSLIVLVAGALRIPAIPHDLPALYTHDEVSTVETALRFGTGSLRPYSFGHGPLMSYVMAGLYGAYYAGLRLTGSLSRPDEFILRYLADPTPFYLLHRGLTVALSLGVVVLVSMVGRRLFSPRVGLIAALFTAFVNVLFVLSVAGREDLLYLFLVLLGVYASIPIYEGRGTARAWIASGACMGLATSAKYFGVFGLLFPLLALGREVRRVSGAAGILGGFLGGLLLGMPVAILDFGRFVGDVLTLGTQTSGATYGVSTMAGLTYSTVHLMSSVGLPLQLLAALGAVLLFLRARRVAVYLLTPCLAFLTALSTRSGNQAHYYVAFVVPFLCLSAAWAVEGLGGTTRRAQVFGGVLVTLVLLPNLTADLRYLRYLWMPDTREAARVWIERNVLPGASILIETRATDFGIRQGPPLQESVETLRRELEEIRRRGGSGRLWEYRIARALLDGAALRYELVKAHTVRPEMVEAAASEFLVLSSGPQSDASAYRALPERYVLLAVFPSSANFPGDTVAQMEELSAVPLGSQPDPPMRGPIISIWKRKALHSS